MAPSIYEARTTLGIPDAPSAAPSYARMKPSRTPRHSMALGSFPVHGRAFCSAINITDRTACRLRDRRSRMVQVSCDANWSYFQCSRGLYKSLSNKDFFSALENCGDRSITARTSEACRLKAVERASSLRMRQSSSRYDAVVERVCTATPGMFCQL